MSLISKLSACFRYIAPKWICVFVNGFCTRREPGKSIEPKGQSPILFCKLACRIRDEKEVMKTGAWEKRYSFTTF